jgi:Resolvase, N terminal domain
MIAFREESLRHYGKFVAYFPGLHQQGKSGLGVEAQREAVNAYLNGGRWSLVQDFVEVESGTRNDRPELAAALAACKKHKAKLIIAKLDRLSRNLAFIATLMDSGVEFVAVDNPHANKLSHLRVAIASAVWRPCSYAVARSLTSPTASRRFPAYFQKSRDLSAASSVYLTVC